METRESVRWQPMSRYELKAFCRWWFRSSMQELLNHVRRTGGHLVVVPGDRP